MLDSARLISRFATGTYTVTRRTASTYVAGRAVAGSSSTLTITASVQPASGRELERLPEGRRAKETRVLYTTTPLYVGGQGAAYEADRIAIGGATWEVQHVEAWPAAGGYTRALVQVAS